MDSSSEENVKDQWDDDDDSDDHHHNSDELTTKAKTQPAKPAKSSPETEKTPKSALSAKAETDGSKSPATIPDPLTEDTIDLYEPTTKEQFDRFESLIKEKLTKYDKSVHYVPLLDGLLKELCQNLDMDDVKKISTTLTAVSNEKLKQSKTSKVKKKGKKAALTAGKDADGFDYDYNNDYDAYEDYL